MSMDAFAAQVGDDIKTLRRKTGWRNLSNPAITAGKVQICRVGTRVYMNWDAAVFGTQSGHVYLPGIIPEGFRTPIWIPFSTVAVYGPALGCRLMDATAQGGPGTVHIAGLTSGAILRTYVMWETEQPWPTVLPGTPA